MWSLKDKNGTPYSLDRPADFLSSKALQRRSRQHIALDSTDLPVNPAYINEIRSTGVDVVSRSKWNNTVLVRSRQLSKLKSVALLGCVKSIRKVWTSPDSIVSTPPRARFHSEFNRWGDVVQSRYGVTFEQMEMVDGVMMHNRGFRGRGMTIAVLDGGFMNADRIPCLKAATVLGVEDFVVPRSESVFREMDHGTKVLSVMAVDVPDTYIGAAPDASYWLLRCEDGYTESLAEEDYWAAAVEFADSVGVDIISSSLGFHAFDNPADNYTYTQARRPHGAHLAHGVNAGRQGHSACQQCRQRRHGFVEEDKCAGRRRRHHYRRRRDARPPQRIVQQHRPNSRQPY